MRIMLAIILSVAVSLHGQQTAPKATGAGRVAANLARNFPGSGSNYLLGSTLFVSLSNSFTIAAFIKNGSVAQTNAYVLETFDGDGDVNQFSLIYGFAANQYQLYLVGGSGTNPQSISGITISDTNYHHIAYTYNGTTLIGYLDGTQQFSTAITFSTTASQGLIVGGAYYFGFTAPVNAAVGQLVLATTPLTSGNITSLVSCTDPTTLGLGASLLSWWPMKIGGSPELDSSGNGNNLTVTGTTTVSGPAGC